MMMGLYTRKFRIDWMATQAVAYAAVFAAGVLTGLILISALGGLEGVIQATADALK